MKSYLYIINVNCIQEQAIGVVGPKHKTREPVGAANRHVKVWTCQKICRGFAGCKMHL